ncbi:MAG: hypothetical protein JXQ72_13825 [Anaerolineae bacterium]|nr:hypothetical protein [Anaerolineae bacterium]
MPSQRTVSLKLPAELYERISQAAAFSGQTVEEALLSSLALVYGTVPEEVDDALNMLDSCSDDQLWAVVYQRLAWPEWDRLRDLMAKGKLATLTPAEQVELEALLGQVDRYTAWRARALWLLKHRSQDMG